jgi:hypothetical protein
VPHLTVLTCDDQELLERAAVEVAAALPVHSRVTHVWLMAERDHGGWDRVETFWLADA